MDEHRSVRVWDTVLSEFKAIPGYQVKSSLVLAKDYGAPQNRPRVLLVGIRKDILSKSDLIDRHSDSDDAINCGFLPAKEQQSYPDLIDLLGDLVDPNIEGILKLETTQRVSLKQIHTQLYQSTPNSRTP